MDLAGPEKGGSWVTIHFILARQESKHEFAPGVRCAYWCGRPAPRSPGQVSSASGSLPGLRLNPLDGPGLINLFRHLKISTFLPRATSRG